MSSLLLSAGAFRIHEQAADLLRRVFLQMHAEPGPEHLLLAIIRANHELIGALLASFQIERDRLERALFEHTLRAGSDQLLESCAAFGGELLRTIGARQSKIADEWDLFGSVLRTESRAIRAALSDCGVSAENLLTFLDAPGMKAFACRYRLPEPSLPPSAHRRTADGMGFKLTMLEQYGRNLTAIARRGELRPALFREREIQETLETLCRQTERNPILVGEPGVGKTSIVYGLAQRISRADHDSRVRGKELFQVDFASIATTVAHRDELQQRVQTIISECREQAVILFVEDFPRIFAEPPSGRHDPAAAMLRRALLDGDIQCVGECAPSDYTKQIVPDTALALRCQRVLVEELSTHQTVELLAQDAPRIEQFHHVSISRPAISAAVEMGEQFLPDRKLPAKAISLLDASAAHVSLHGGHSKTVGPDAVAEMVGRLTGMDPAQLLAFRVENLTTVESFLKSRIIGQDETIRKLVDKLQIERSGLSMRPERPDAVMLLAGPTGVGKTETARCLAEALQGSPDKLIRFDMSEFMERHTVAKLIGAPPGYIGYDDDAQLVSRVRANPRGVILFDEIEKAHPDVHNVFLQVFDAGRLTDSHGLTADFSQTVIIMTSNLGVRNLNPDSLLTMTPDQRTSHLRQVCEHAIREFFAPEFLNRLDEVIYMDFLTPESAIHIAENQLRFLLEQLARRAKTAEVAGDVLDLIVNEGYSPQYGARFLTRTIENRVVKPLAKFLLESPACNRFRIQAQGHEIFFSPMSG